VTTKQVVSDKKTPKHTPSRGSHDTATHETHATTPTPKPPDGAQGGSDTLYNPF